MTAGSSQLPGLTWCRVAVQNAAKQQPNSFFPLEREKQIPAGLRRGISWGEAQEHHEGTNSASPVALCLPMGWVTRLCAQQDCCCHGAGYFPQRGWGGGLGFGVSGWMLRMLDSQLPPPRMLLLVCFPPSLHTFQPGSAAESHLAVGGTRDLPTACPPSQGETHQNHSREEKHWAPSSPGHPR